MLPTSFSWTRATSSKRPPKAVPLAVLAISLAALAACAPKTPEGIDEVALNEAVGTAIGDATTCVMIVEKGSAKVVYRYGTHMNCEIKLPSCEGAAETTVDEVAKAAAQGQAKMTSCPTPAGRVGWTAGPLPATKPQYQNLAYAAAMNSTRTLPGIEMQTRLTQAFAKAGL